MAKLMLKYVMSWFTKDRIGVLVRALFSQVGKQLASQILDPANQQKAYEFAKELYMNKEMTNEEKAKAFNEKMREYAKGVGKTIAECAVNCLRELAVSAVKGEAD